MSFVSITIEGGLLAADLLERLGAAPDGVEGQRGSDFGYNGPRLTEEIQAAFADLKSYWTTFQARRQRGSENLTTLTRQAWVSQLLVRLVYGLEFQRSAAEIGGVRYPISHRAADEMAVLPVHVVSWQQDLGKSEDGRISPHALVQEYLNRSDALWGIVTNGRRLRLLRDSALITRPSYVEFDLETMMEGNLYNEFVLFYRLVHRTRLPERMGDQHSCLIERYYQQGIEEGGRVRERLREGVEEALRILGTGFLANPASEGLRAALDGGGLDPLSFYRELLRLIYRILFLMVAEERRLLFPGGPAAATRRTVYDRWYSVTALRERADRRVPRDPHGDLWVGLTQTFRLFRDPEAAEPFGLGVLNGELFGERACAHLETQAGIANDVLLKAIHALSTFEEDAGRGRRGVRRRVHYGGLDVEELGSIYESLLEYHPRVSLDPAEFDLILGGERKSTGSYYTPPALVRELIDSALVPAIDRRLAAAGPGREAREAALLSMTVCDPAAGSGHFVLAAARRIGRALAQVRGEEREPSPEDYRLAVRDAIRNCIYAVDRNQLAVDLCKVALWIEGHCAGLPLSFLDHRVRWGDSLVGVFDLAALSGVPDGAYKPLGGDAAEVARRVKRLNRAERDGRDLFEFDAAQAQETLSTRFGAVSAVRDDTADAVHDKQRRYNEIRTGDPDWLRLRAACDLWTAAFYAPLSGDTGRRVPTTRHVREALTGHGEAPEAVAATVKALAQNLRFFHWPLEFPEVFKAGGFDVVLGNPPWERIKLQEQEFFAARDPEIARVSDKSRRDELIQALFAPGASDFQLRLRDDLVAERIKIERKKNSIRATGRFPHTSNGDFNLFALFVELFCLIKKQDGSVGALVPTAIVTDKTCAPFFAFLMEESILKSVKGFDEVRSWFKGTDDRKSFSLVALGKNEEKPEYIFGIKDIKEIEDDRRWFSLDYSEICKINPSTKTCPIFLSKYDADLIASVYTRFKVLSDSSSGWRLKPTAMFHSSSCVKLFERPVEPNGSGHVEHESAVVEEVEYLRLYEQTMIHQYDHRWRTFVDRNATRLVTVDEKSNPDFLVAPSQWVRSEDVMQWRLRNEIDSNWYICWRRTAKNSDTRSVSVAVLPKHVAMKDSIFIMTHENSDQEAACLVAIMNSIVFDYLARQKFSGGNLSYYFIEQTPIPDISSINKNDMDFLCERVHMLCYTSRDNEDFSRSLGGNRAPFVFNRDKRNSIRAEIDAYVAYLYGLNKRQLNYILKPKSVMGADFPVETFRSLEDLENNLYKKYLTERLVLEAWDRFTEDGTFELTRLPAPESTEAMRQRLIVYQSRLVELEQVLAELVPLVDAQSKPTLFVEGASDVPVVEAAWSVFFPDDPLPFAVVPAGGTKQMQSLATPARGAVTIPSTNSHIGLTRPESRAPGQRRQTGLTRVHSAAAGTPAP